mmetsp:Transcript_23038/g.41603  ORF Transcript_23038/g.41603 Transcript_23038/m.41603 type:complete len:267 (-) Transcript_23038:282-1082(-)
MTAARAFNVEDAEAAQDLLNDSSESETPDVQFGQNKKLTIAVLAVAAVLVMGVVTFMAFQGTAASSTFGANEVQQLSEASTLSSDASASLILWPDRAKLPSSCPWGFDDIGKVVSDECCEGGHSGATVTAMNPTKEEDGNDYSCFVADLGGGNYARDFFGCSDGKVTLSEGCHPNGAAFGSKTSPYPMHNKTFAMTQYVNGDVDSCNCGFKNETTGKKKFDSVYQGEGCYVALSFYHVIKGFYGEEAALKQGGKGAYFIKLAGSCS